ncbi:MAG: hypothetical protein PHH54_02485 [Candidatus Nanoarchaeia archaeon]|nr:hypothetical protein [Candidatus Nanoarchaeia archaeon]MDD5740829.1 hypothetical protein [Candidatus Nanoarchaeia archaeon]
MKKFHGLLLRESLRDLGVLKLVRITKEDKWDVDNAADFQPKIWNAVEFEGDAEKAEEIAEKMSKAMNPRWYMNIGTKKEEFVIFLNKIFKYSEGDEEGKKKAQEYARSLNIPESQIDW